VSVITTLLVITLNSISIWNVRSVVSERCLIGLAKANARKYEIGKCMLELDFTPPCDGRHTAVSLTAVTDGGVTAVRMTAVTPGQVTRSISSEFDIDAGVTAARVRAVRPGQIRSDPVLTAVTAVKLTAVTRRCKIVDSRVTAVINR